MRFAVSIFWRCFGLAMLAFARSFARDGASIIEAAIGTVGVIALAAGTFL
jgi:hypothetical protein